MSYDIQLYRKEVKDLELASNDDSFFEKEENLLPFTAEQKSSLINLLKMYKYSISNEDQYGIHFEFEDDNSISVLLADSCLYFSSTGEGIFEISMTSSEFTDTAEFVKYDPQNDGWEIF